MARKQNDFYFDNFLKCGEFACDAANFLVDTLNHFDSDTMQNKLRDIHAIEHRADMEKAEMVEELLRAFITPLERDDILKLSHSIDNVTDALEDILIRIYIGGIKKISNSIISFAELLKKCCEAVKEVLIEFKNFKKSKSLKELLLKVMHLEEEGDKMFIEIMHELFTSKKDAVEIVIWKEIIWYFEKCCDACESVADTIQGIVISNT